MFCERRFDVNTFSTLIFRFYFYIPLLLLLILVGINLKPSECDIKVNNYVGASAVRVGVAYGWLEEMRRDSVVRTPERFSRLAGASSPLEL